MRFYDGYTDRGGLMTNQPPYQPPYEPQPMSPSDERMWATFAHLAPFAGALIGLPFLGPLVIYLIDKDRSAYVRSQSSESLNFQLTLLIGYLVSFVLALVAIGFVLLFVIVIASIVLQILGALAANRGEDFRYPMTIRFVS